VDTHIYTDKSKTRKARGDKSGPQTLSSGMASVSKMSPLANERNDRRRASLGFEVAATEEPLSIHPHPSTARLYPPSLSSITCSRLIIYKNERFPTAGIFILLHFSAYSRFVFSILKSSSIITRSETVELKENNRSTQREYTLNWLDYSLNTCIVATKQKRFSCLLKTIKANNDYATSFKTFLKGANIYTFGLAF
jgi:hypothetical protein